MHAHSANHTCAAPSAEAGPSGGEWNGMGGGAEVSGTTGANAATVAMQGVARKASKESDLRRPGLGVKQPRARGRHTAASVSVRQTTTPAVLPSSVAT